MKSISLTNDDRNPRDEQLQRELKAAGALPDHIAIIMDGNGRWAKSKGNKRTSGHKAGVESVRDITEACAQLGVRYLTLYTFSTENWCRPKAEVKTLMRILVNSLRKEADNLNENDIKLTAIGQTERFSKKCTQKLNEVIELTKQNERLELCLALSYSGRWDILEATKKISRKVEQGQITPDEIDDNLFSSYLSTADVPDPDLIIRTSGEYRISNFLLWQLAYSEFFVTKTYWPDFRRNELYKAISSYQSRERRFGGVEGNKSQSKSVGSFVQELIT